MLRAFGVERCFFASNFPMDKVSAPWTAIFEAFAALTAGYDQAARRKLFSENAARFYGLDARAPKRGPEVAVPSENGQRGASA